MRTKVLLAVMGMQVVPMLVAVDVTEHKVVAKDAYLSLFHAKWKQRLHDILKKYRTKKIQKTYKKRHIIMSQKSHDDMSMFSLMAGIMFALVVGMPIAGLMWNTLDTYDKL